MAQISLLGVQQSAFWLLLLIGRDCLSQLEQEKLAKEKEKTQLEILVELCLREGSSKSIGGQEGRSEGVGTLFFPSYGDLNVRWGARR